MRNAAIADSLNLPPSEFMMNWNPSPLHPKDFAGASYSQQRTELEASLEKEKPPIQFVAGTLAHGQQADAMLGFGTILSSGSTSCGVSSCVIPEKGGLYPSVSADVIFHKRIGFNFEAAWKASRGNYAGLGIPFRPILFDFNG